MVIVALYGGCRLLEADVIEPSKGSAADVFDRVVWDQELFLHTDGGGQGRAGMDRVLAGGSKGPRSPSLSQTCCTTADICVSTQAANSIRVLLEYSGCSHSSLCLELTKISNEEKVLGSTHLPPALPTFQSPHIEGPREGGLCSSPGTGARLLVTSGMLSHLTPRADQPLLSL